MVPDIDRCDCQQQEKDGGHGRAGRGRAAGRRGAPARAISPAGRPPRRRRRASARAMRPLVVRGVVVVAQKVQETMKGQNAQLGADRHGPSRGPAGSRRRWRSRCRQNAGVRGPRVRGLAVRSSPTARATVSGAKDSTSVAASFPRYWRLSLRMRASVTSAIATSPRRRTGSTPASHRARPRSRDPAALAVGHRHDARPYCRDPPYDSYALTICCTS